MNLIFLILMNEMSNQFHHQALKLSGEKKLIYTAMSKHLFYYRMHVSQFVLHQNCVPLNPFMLFDYFLLDSVERDIIRAANNSLVKRADALWAFGPISDGVLAEIRIARTLNIPLRFFTIEASRKVVEISAEQVEMEEEVKSYESLITH